VRRRQLREQPPRGGGEAQGSGGLGLVDMMDLRHGISMVLYLVKINHDIKKHKI